MTQMQLSGDTADMSRFAQSFIAACNRVHTIASELASNSKNTDDSIFLHETATGLERLANLEIIRFEDVEYLLSAYASIRYWQINSRKWIIRE